MSSVFLSGDQAACDHAKKRCPQMTVLPVKEGTGSSTWNMHPQDAVDAIYDGVKTSLKDISRVNCKGCYGYDDCENVHDRDLN